MLPVYCRASGFTGITTTCLAQHFTAQKNSNFEPKDVVHEWVEKRINCMSYGLNLGWEGPIGDYIGFWGAIKGHIANLVQDSYRELGRKNRGRKNRRARVRFAPYRTT